MICVRAHVYLFIVYATEVCDGYSGWWFLCRLLINSNVVSELFELSLGRPGRLWHLLPT